MYSLLCGYWIRFPSPAAWDAMGYNERIGSRIEDCTAPRMAVKITPDQEIWVLAREAAEITGYSARYLGQLAQKNAIRPEDERDMKVRKRAGIFYEIWLPDLLRYIDEIGYGPHQNK
jgi:hypothetical protein